MGVPQFSILTAKPTEMWDGRMGGASGAVSWVFFNTEAGHEKSRVFTMPQHANLKPA